MKLGADELYSLTACVQWEIKNIFKNLLKTMSPRVGVIGGLAVYLAGLVVYSCMLLLLFWALGSG